MKRIVAIVMGLCLLSLGLSTGCSVQRGYVGHEIQTQVQLSKANFRVLKTVTGEASSGYLFGIGLSYQDLDGRATTDMLKNAGLTGGARAVANVATDGRLMVFPFWFLPIYVVKTVYVSGEVIEFTN